MRSELDISEVREQTGIPTSTLHVWERKGLISSTGRAGLRRQYDPAVLDRIAVIVVLQRSRFTLAEIGDLLADDAFADGKQLLLDKLAALIRLRDDVDLAIDGLRHAVDCPNPSPLECPGFQSHLVHVLPVDRTERTESRVQENSPG